MNSKIINLNGIADERGLLVSIESNKNIPFQIKRIYYLTNLKQGKPRGFHAHKNLKQIAICLKGSCRILLDDGNKEEGFLLSNPTVGLVIGERYWRVLDQFSED